MTRKSTVYGIKCRNDELEIKEKVFSCLNEINARDHILNSKYMIIKPNYVINEHYSRGNTTNPLVLKAIIEYAFSIHPDLKVAMGEGGFTSDTDGAFKTNGLPALCKEFDMELINFNKDDKCRVKIPGAKALKQEILIARNAIDCDLLVSVPSLKTHSLATTTLSIKNFMGTLSRKSIMHSRIHLKIPDLFSLFREKAKFALIDGIIGSEGYECGGNPVPHEVLLASTDLVALDTISSYIMGINLNECKYLFNAASRGYGNCNMDDIRVKGIDLDEVIRPYQPT
ncbi:MAG: DUF362 domain-containing protein [Promethearchaeota archaeon]